MRIIFILFLSFLFSCKPSTREEKNIPDSTLENPWTYINRISDTLPETEFSLNNSREKNRSILSKFNMPFLEFKYRIGQNQFLKVRARNIINDGGIYCYFEPYPFEINININGEIWIKEYDVLLNESNTDSIQKLYLNHIVYNTRDGDLLSSSYFILNCHMNTNQNILRKIISKLSDTYYKFILIRNKDFINLKTEKQNEILKESPFVMIYQFFDEIPIPIKN